ncbi:MAG: hypothetical protein M3A44_11275 [Gammaproteobacteria bacterium]
MIKAIYKIITVLLALTLMAVPMRISYAGIHTAMAEQASPTSGLIGNSHHHTDMDDAASNADQCEKGHPTKSGTHDCSSGAHCCFALITTRHDMTHVSPSTPRSTLTVIVTGIIIPTATKPPRNIL